MTTFERKVWAVPTGGSSGSCVRVAAALHDRSRVEVYTESHFHQPRLVVSLTAEEAAAAIAGLTAWLASQAKSS